MTGSRSFNSRALVVALLLTFLTGCNAPILQAALRQKTEDSVSPPVAGVVGAGSDDPALRMRNSDREQSGPHGSADSSNFNGQEPLTQVTYMAPIWRTISNSELVQWQSQQASVFIDQDPDLRPDTMPRPFAQSDWNNYLPFFPPSTKATFTSDYGWRQLYGRLDFHPAIDIAAAPKTPVFSPLSGVIIRAVDGGPENAGVVILSGERQYTFWHVSPLKGLKTGDIINAGQQLGTLTPWGSRTHLHFAIHLTGDTLRIGKRTDFNAVDPISATWRAAHTGVDLFAPSSTTGRSILRLDDPVAHQLGF